MTGGSFQTDKDVNCIFFYFSSVEESWTDEDIGSHKDAFVSNEFQEEGKISPPPQEHGDGFSSNEAIKGRRGR